jgi:hypothetical protein
MLSGPVYQNKVVRIEGQVKPTYGLDREVQNLLRKADAVSNNNKRGVKTSFGASGTAGNSRKKTADKNSINGSIRTSMASGKPVDLRTTMFG